MTVKAALTTDKTSLKAREENSLEIVFWRILFGKLSFGYEMHQEERTSRGTARGQNSSWRLVRGRWLSTIKLCGRRRHPREVSPATVAGRTPRIRG